MIYQKFVIFISHKRSRVWKRYVTRLCIIISSACVIFLVNLDDFFILVCTSFHSKLISIAYVAISKRPQVLFSFPLLSQFFSRIISFSFPPSRLKGLIRAHNILHDAFVQSVWFLPMLDMPKLQFSLPQMRLAIECQTFRENQWI